MANLKKDYNIQAPKEYAAEHEKKALKEASRIKRIAEEICKEQSSTEEINMILDVILLLCLLFVAVCVRLFPGVLAV